MRKGYGVRPGRRKPPRQGPTPALGTALDGTGYHLPAGLPAERTLAVLAFRQRQQADVDRWIDLAVSLGVPGTPLGAPEPRATAVVEDPVAYRRSCGIITADQVTTMLVDREGKASFQALGPPTKEQADELTTALGLI